MLYVTIAGVLTIIDHANCEYVCEYIEACSVVEEPETARIAHLERVCDAFNDTIRRSGDFAEGFKPLLQLLYLLIQSGAEKLELQVNDTEVRVVQFN